MDGGAEGGGGAGEPGSSCAGESDAEVVYRQAVLASCSPPTKKKNKRQTEAMYNNDPLGVPLLLLPSSTLFPS